MLELKSLVRVSCCRAFGLASDVIVNYNVKYQPLFFQKKMFFKHILDINNDNNFFDFTKDSSNYFELKLPLE